MFDVIRQFLKYLKKEKKIWLAPVFLVMVFLGWMLVIASKSVLAPFIYTLF